MGQVVVEFALADDSLLFLLFADIDYLYGGIVPRFDRLHLQLIKIRLINTSLDFLLLLLCSLRFFSFEPPSLLHNLFFP